jgi:hypothetical protein
MPKVTFLIDPDKEYEYHQLFQKVPEFNRMSIFAYTPIDDKPRIIKKIQNFWDDEDRAAIKKIEDEWRIIEKDYFELIREITGVEWLYDEYFAYFLAFSTVIGFSNPFNLKSQEIIMTPAAAINPKFIVAHELFHSHYFYVVDKLGMTGIANKTLFTEGVAALVLFKTKMKELFPNTDFQSSINSYPQVAKEWDKLVNLWEKRKNFKDFLIEITNQLK